jgi:AraC-like DNA-binding protein/ABC-type Fe3+-hydroxamate transport system substrate-binding protein
MVSQQILARQHTLYILSSIRRFRRMKDFTIPLRSVPVSILCFITKGTGILSINDTLHPIEPLQLFYLVPGMMVEATAHSREIEYYIILIDQITVTKQRSRWKVSDPESTLPLPHGLVPISDAGLIFGRIQQLYESNGLNRDLSFQELLGFIIRDLSKRQSEQSTDNGIDLSIAYMNEHFHEKITRETLAKMAQLTPNAFCRSFKRATGLSPTDYLNGIRIHHAKEQLGPGSSVKDVAAATGYGSEYYFSRIFKETVGLSPTLFIKRERLKVATASRVGFQDNLASIGMEAVASVDCYRYPGLDEEEYSRRVISSMEQLRLVKPDLIIADFFHSSFYDAFKEFAPTVIVKHHLDWRVIHMNIAELVGREKEAVQTFNQLDEKTAEARKLLKSSSEKDSITILQVMHKCIRIQGSINHPLNDLIYSGLAMRPGLAVPRNKMRQEWAIEELPPLQSGHLFIAKHSNHPEIEQLLTQLQASPAVNDRQRHFVPNWLVMSWTPQGRNRIIDEILTTTMA